MIDIRAVGKVVWKQALGLEGRGFNGMNAIVSVVSPSSRTVCGEQIQPQCPILELWSVHESSGGTTNLLTVRACGGN